MQQIPLETTPNQHFSVVLGGQDCTIALYARGSRAATRLYCDLAVSGVQVWSGVLCRNLVDLKSYPALHFEGALWFVECRAVPIRSGRGLGNGMPFFTPQKVKPFLPGYRAHVIRGRPAPPKSSSHE